MKATIKNLITLGTLEIVTINKEISVRIFSKKQTGNIFIVWAKTNFTTQ